MNVGRGGTAEFCSKKTWYVILEKLRAHTLPTPYKIQETIAILHKTTHELNTDSIGKDYFK